MQDELPPPDHPADHPASSHPCSPDPALVESARAWLAGWSAEVAAARTDVARARFDDAVVGFGTYAQHPLVGLDQLHADQWSNVWPTIENFAFDVEQAIVLASPDGLQAVLIAPWTSTKRDAADVAQPRPGRATVVLARDGADRPWRGVHTHFSLVPAPG